MIQRLRKFWCDKKGGAAIEYSLMAALFAISAIAAFQLFGASLSKTYSEIPEQMEGAGEDQSDDDNDKDDD
jgi:Flp pilus assembly pilin Flp